jgi:hypothetical protein
VSWGDRARGLWYRAVVIPGVVKLRVVQTKAKPERRSLRGVHATH